MKKRLPIFLAALIVIAGGAYLFLHHKTSPVDPTAWKTYTNKEFSFSFQYPPNFTLTERAITADNYIEVGVSDPATQAPYLSITIWGKQSDIATANEYFVGPFPKTIPPEGNNSSMDVVERTLGGVKGIERYGYGGEGTSYDDVFMYKNKYLYAVSLDGVMEGRITQEREPGAPTPDKIIYERIVSSVYISQ